MREKRKLNSTEAPKSKPAKIARLLLHAVFCASLSLLVVLYRLIEIVDGEKGWKSLKFLDYKKAEPIKLLLLSAIDELSEAHESAEKD